MATRLNQRFRRGVASNELAAAGVLVHQLDGYEDPLQPWLPCNMGTSARGCGDRTMRSIWSCSLINEHISRGVCSARVNISMCLWRGGVAPSVCHAPPYLHLYYMSAPHRYSACHTGLVFTPSIAAAAVLCAYDRDGGTQGKHSKARSD